MTNIKFEDIDFSKLSKLEDVCSTNDVYLFENKIIKIFKKYKQEELKDLEKKIELLGEKSYFDFLNIPQEKIIKDNKLSGIVLPFINNSMTLNELLQRKGIVDSLSTLKDASIRLSRLHRDSDRILVGDMHFDNIIIDDKGNNHFIDVESYGIQSLKPSDIPSITYNYYTWMNYYICHSSNMDKISFFLALFSSIFNKNIISVSENEYEIKSKQILILEKLKDVFLDLKYSYAEEPDMPYLYEVINDDDIKRYSYEIDRI